MELITLRIAATVVSLLVFLGILAWAYSGGQRRRFEHDAGIPFREDDPALRVVSANPHHPASASAAAASTERLS